MLQSRHARNILIPIFIPISHVQYFCWLEIHYERPLDDGDHVLDYSGYAYICSGRDLRLRFRRGRKRTAVPENAPLGDVAQCGTETWNFRRKWIIWLLVSFAADVKQIGTFEKEKKRRESTTKGRRWRIGSKYAI